MKKQVGILALFILCSSSSFCQKIKYQPKNELYIRMQPLYLITHSTFMLEAEYYFSPAHGLALDWFYSLGVTGQEFICLRCAMTDNADNRYMLSLNYKYYLPFLERSVYVSPYMRWRNWQGKLGDFVNETLFYGNEYNRIVSNGLAFGGTVGAHFSEKGRFDFTIYMGGGKYFYESYKPQDGQTIDNYLISEWRLGINIGFRICKAKPKP